VSGPLKGQPQTRRTTTTRFCRGGVGGDADRPVPFARRRTETDWSSSTPGYPDNHSGLTLRADRPTPRSLLRHLLSAMLKAGRAAWRRRPVTQRRGLRLAVGVRNYNLVTQSMPVFVASPSGRRPDADRARPVRIFAATYLSPPPAPRPQPGPRRVHLLNPPGRSVHTLQFNAGVYCAPTRRSLGP